MSNFTNLVVNEWLKMFKKRSFFVPYAIILMIIAVVSYIIYGQNMDFGYYMSGAFSDAAFGTFLTILIIIMTAGIVSSEYSSGTIKFLLIRTQSRSQILASKYVVVLLYALSIYIFAFVATLISAFAFTAYNANVVDWGSIITTISYSLIYALVYITLTFMIGVFTRSAAATIGLAIALNAFEDLFVILLKRYEISKYFFITNMNLDMYGEGATPLFPGMTLNFSLLIIFIYLVLFLAASFVTFKKRDVS